MTADAAGIDARGVDKRFGAIRALDSVDLTIPPGDIGVLLGENGAGKTTLTRILGTSVLPDAGTIRLAGIDAVADAHRARGRIGMLLSEERSWYWRLTGRHNLEFFAALRGMQPDAASERVQVLLEQFDLAPAADRRFDSYSSGMKVRLALARAMLGDPDVLLLDEPTRSLDPVARAEFHERLRETVRVRRPAVLLATHDLHEAAVLASHLHILVLGRIVERLEGGTTAAELERVLLSAIR